MIDETKLVNNLGGFPAGRSYSSARGLVARQLKQFSSTPFGAGFVPIRKYNIRFHDLKIATERIGKKINDIPGVCLMDYSLLERPIPCYLRFERNLCY
ncbi:MAG: hypothetical protein Ct9H90mP27_3520 [Gammaproteobacteria bacterium]|nr:MAG: hypothetical protein Ct9H90mP27_3520 [Gammaproteobacteria bacterium]